MLGEGMNSNAGLNGSHFVGYRRRLAAQNKGGAFVVAPFCERSRPRLGKHKSLEERA